MCKGRDEPAGAVRAGGWIGDTLPAARGRAGATDCTTTYHLAPPRPDRNALFTKHILDTHGGHRYSSEVFY